MGCPRNAFSYVEFPREAQWRSIRHSHSAVDGSAGAYACTGGFRLLARSSQAPVCARRVARHQSCSAMGSATRRSAMRSAWPAADSCRLRSDGAGTPDSCPTPSWTITRPMTSRWRTLCSSSRRPYSLKSALTAARSGGKARLKPQQK